MNSMNKQRTENKQRNHRREKPFYYCFFLVFFVCICLIIMEVLLLEELFEVCLSMGTAGPKIIEQVGKCRGKMQSLKELILLHESKGKKYTSQYCCYFGTTISKT